MIWKHGESWPAPGQPWPRRFPRKLGGSRIRQTGPRVRRRLGEAIYYRWVFRAISCWPGRQSGKRIASHNVQLQGFEGFPLASGVHGPDDTGVLVVTLHQIAMAGVAKKHAQHDRLPEVH